MDQSTTSANPYADAALVYRQLGWLGVLPADLNGRPGHVPAGFSGGHVAVPDDEQVERWRRQYADHNVALRLPDGPEYAVLGVDVDAYGEKHGDETITWLADQHELGDLPPTWTSTARGADQPSRIHLFRVPPGINWRSDLGRGSAVEIIRHGHRWARVWPSVNPRLRGKADVDPTYRWYTPEGVVSAVPPRPEQLTELGVDHPWVAVLRDDSAVRPPNAVERDERQGHYAGQDGPATDVDGQPVDPDDIMQNGIPIGSQQQELFRYFCSLRARNMRRSEMIALGMVVMQRLENDPAREPWQPGDIVDLVDHVRRDYAPGAASTLSPQLQQFAERLGSGGTIEVNEAPLVEESATDLGNSLRFARLFRDRCRFTEDVERWYVWDGQRWAPDAKGLAVVDLTKHVIDDLRRQAFVDDDHRDRWLQWAHQSEALARRKAMVDGARSEPNLRAALAEFDRDSDVLVVRNGTVDLRTGQLRESRPDDMNSHLAEVDFDPEARHDRWLRHVEMLCDGDEELSRYMARAAGYSLTGGTGDRAFFFLEGKGSNGKNTFIEPLISVLGSYAKTASTSLLTGGDEQHPTVLADLLGARLVFVDETRRGKPLNVERIKALTGSRDVKARQMRQDFFEFEARFKLWIAGNGTPKLQDDSDGTWDRLHRVVCRGRVTAERKIPRYGDVLYREEGSGILNWALAGLADWRKRGSLAVPEVVKTAVAQYRHDENYELQFVEESVLVTGSRDDKIQSKHLYRIYEWWCDQNGVRLSERKNNVYLSRAITDFELDGVERAEWKINGVKVRGFSGLRWADPETTPLWLLGQGS